MVRIFIYAGTVLIVGIALLLFDDVQQGLPIVNLAIWSILVVTGSLVFLRARRRRRQRERREQRARMAAAPLHPGSSHPRLTNRSGTMKLPRR